MKRTILVTGGCGFIGSNFLRLRLQDPEDMNEYINLDSLTYAANPSFLYPHHLNPRYTFVQGDIRDRNLVRDLMDYRHVTDLIHFAAESHVDNSIENPEAFTETNVVGTGRLLEAARRWMDPQNRFLHVSTDEVFGALGDEGKFTEASPLAPNSPYSATKAASDLLVRAYGHTYGLNVVTTNCTNNFGPNQHAEKLIPTIIRRAMDQNRIPLFGSGLQVRDWIFVEDHCRAIWQVFNEGRTGETYLIGAEREKTNRDVVKAVLKALHRIEPQPPATAYGRLVEHIGDRPGHDWRYAIDASKMRSLGWAPEVDFEDGITRTVKWYYERWTR